MIKLKPAQLRTMAGNPELRKDLSKNSIYIIVDNVLDTYNIGAIFRLADAVACKKFYLLELLSGHHILELRKHR